MLRVVNQQENDATGSGESEIDWLRWRLLEKREVDFRDKGESHRKERSVIRRKDDIGWRERVTTDEGRLLREGW